MCQVLIFPLVRFQRYRGPKFFPFSNMAPQHVMYDVIIINNIFYMSSHTNGEKFVSIRQAVAEKNMKVLCRQTNRQTDRQTDPNAMPSPSARTIKFGLSRSWGSTGQRSQVT